MTDLIDRFYQAYERCHGPLETARTSETTEELLIPGRVALSPDWVVWRPQPCRIDLSPMFASLSQQVGFVYPESFQKWYSAYYTLEVDTSVGRWPATPPWQPGGPLRIGPGDSFSTRALARGLLPFGDEGLMDAGPLCFDARVGDDPDRWPVRFWDHEWIGTENEISPIIFSNFEAMLLGTTRYLEEGGYRNRVTAIDAMCASDPSGAGSTGLDYWSIRRNG
jgi:hypothetical protein